MLAGIVNAQQKNDVPDVNVLISQLSINRDRAVSVQEAMKYNSEKISMLSRNKKIDTKIKMDSLQILVKEHNLRLQSLLNSKQMIILVNYLRSTNALPALDQIVKEHNDKQRMAHQSAQNIPSVAPKKAEKNQ